MLVLDTNLVSELMRPHPAPAVLAWVGAQPMMEMAITAVSTMEIRFGIHVLPEGKRRVELDRKFSELIVQGFADRVLPFDSHAAEACADIRAMRQRTGRRIATEDAMIAAIAKAHGATVVTRDENGFAGCGVPIINPWETPDE
ncbi:MAG: type II toxin-antitoxin system VapC family toxin [Rhodospirillales bacterium]|nr:type II toxin-antitoxin system VapC family toxin [Rhodospirillales bacterium]